MIVSHVEWAMPRPPAYLAVSLLLAVTLSVALRPPITGALAHASLRHVHSVPRDPTGSVGGDLVGVLPVRSHSNGRSNVVTCIRDNVFHTDMGRFFRSLPRDPPGSTGVRGL